MKTSVTVVFGTQDIVIALPDTGPGMAPDEGRRWLDEQFVAHGCEPLRASGKVLTADKILALAAAIGEAGFRDDAALRLAFARAASAAVARPTLRIDVDARTLDF
jgi:hypothetical protein